MQPPNVLLLHQDMCTIYDNSKALMGLCSDDNICGPIKAHSCESQVHYRKEFACGIHTESQWEAMLYAGTHSPVIWIGKSCCGWVEILVDGWWMGKT